MSGNSTERGDVDALLERLTREQLLYLEAIDHHTDHPQLAVSSAIAQYVYDHSPPPKMFFPRPPWHGTRDVITDLRDHGLVDIHHGAARFTPPGAEAYSPENIAVSLTETGQEVLQRGTLEQSDETFGKDSGRGRARS